MRLADLSRYPFSDRSSARAGADERESFFTSTSSRVESAVLQLCPKSRNTSRHCEASLMH